MLPNKDLTRPLVSVIIPTLGRETLQAAINSVVSQTYRPIETIVVFDGVEPRSFDLPDVRCVHLAERGGVSRARNEGIGLSAGAVIAFLDDDDMWRPNFLERLVTALVKSGPRVASVDAGFDLWDGQQLVDRHIPRSKRRLPADLIARPSIWPSTLVIRREALDEVGHFDPSLPHDEDTDLYVRLLSNGWALNPVSEVLADRALHVRSAQAILSLYEATTHRFEHFLEQLSPADRRRAASLREFDLGVLQIQLGNRKQGIASVLKAWLARPLYVRPLLQLARALLGERWWALAARWRNRIKGAFIRWRGV